MSGLMEDSADFLHHHFFVVERCKDWDFKMQMLKTKPNMDTGLQEMHEYARIIQLSQLVINHLHQKSRPCLKPSSLAWPQAFINTQFDHRAVDYRQQQEELTQVGRS